MKKYKRLSDMYLARTGYRVVKTERGYEIAKDGKIVEMAKNDRIMKMSKDGEISDWVWRDRKSAEDFLAVSVMLGFM